MSKTRLIAFIGRGLAALWRGLPLTLSLAALAGCGGGTGGGGTASPPPSQAPALLSAQTFQDLVAQVRTNYPSIAATAFPPLIGGFDTNISSYPSIMTFTNGNPLPFAGKYQHFEQATYPTVNGYAQLESTGHGSNLMSFQGFDPQNQNSGVGTSEAYYAVSTPSNQPIFVCNVPTNTSCLPIIILVQGIAKDPIGNPLYRFLMVYTGQLVNGPYPFFQGSTLVTPTVDGVVGHYFTGVYSIYSLECLNSAGCQTSSGLLATYFDLMIYAGP
jgi:hypothetical protein